MTPKQTISFTRGPGMAPNRLRTRLLRPMLFLAAMLVVSTWGVGSALASTAYGDLNNFDVFNDTGQECHGFEIELEDVHSTDITYTYDWNHYGAPTITEDNFTPGHPKVHVRYAANSLPGGFSAFTAVPSSPPSPTNGHMCTNPSVNFGCEHFGVGYYGTPTAIRYHWLIDDPLLPGNLTLGPAVNVATPSWSYYPPVAAQPAAVQAVILAPPPPPAPVFEFGDAVWVKAIVTTSHNNQRVELKDLVSDDPDDPNEKNWANGEPDEVEVEWRLLQTEFSNPDGANNDLAGANEELPDGDEVVTRRYEFYKYTGPLDPESNEATCDNYPQISDPEDPKYKADCTPDVTTVLGDYIGAQMAGFNVEAVLGLIDHVQDAEVNEAYTDRTVVVGGNTPYVTEVTAGSLPPDMNLDSATGVLSGMPSVAGLYTFTVSATDADSVQVSKQYSIRIGGIVDACAGVVCSASDACHEVGVCDPLTGLCTDPIAADGTGCDDGDACTLSDTCLAGACTGTDPITCSASDACHDAGTCDPATGICSDPMAADGTSCNDGDGCAADSCQAGICEPVACPNGDAVILPVKPLRITIGRGKVTVSKTISVTVRNADAFAHAIELAVDDGDCPAGLVQSIDFAPGTRLADTSALVQAGKTAKAKLQLAIKSADFTSFNLKAPTRCTLRLTAEAIVDGGSNEPTPDNNVALLELSVIDKNDPEQTIVHETTIKSGMPTRLIIGAGASSETKVLKVAVGHADHPTPGANPGDLISLSADTTCAGLMLGDVVCNSSTGNAATVNALASKTCEVPVVADAHVISTPNQISPQRCTVTLTATGPSDPQVAPLDATNNSTQVVIDVLDRND